MNLADFHFIRPYWLLAILPLIVMVVLILRKKLNQGNWTACCDAELLPFLLQEHAVNQSRVWLSLGIISTLLMIVALAGPSWQRLPSPAFRNEAALVIALNLSPSMDAADIKPSRLTIARYKIADILKQRKDGQTALLVYSGDAFTVTPLTNDTNTIDSQLEALTTDIMPSQGNNTAAVLEKSADLFKQTGLQTGQILLITNAVDNDATLPTVEKLANFQLSILGVGTEDGAPIALPEGGFLKDQQGSIVVTKLDSDNLSRLAQAGHGVYQTITADDKDIQTLLKAIDKPQQQSKERNDIKLEQWEEQGVWLLLLVLPLGALFFRKGLLCLGLLLLLPLPKNSYALDWQDLWQRADQQALTAYQQQDYAKAAQKFENPDWKAAAHYQAGEYDQALKTYQSQTEQTANSWYNQGNALAQSGQLKEALVAYQKALSINPNDTDAQFNKELVEKELEKQQQPPPDKQDKKDDKQDKQDQSEQKKSSPEQGDKSQQSEQKQSEKNESEQQAEQQEQQQAEQKQEKGQKELEQQEDIKKEVEQKQAEQKKSDQKTPTQQQAKPAPTPAKDEKQQANEQWLNRIPDDPAGLLRRKFKYQYGRNQ